MHLEWWYTFSLIILGAICDFIALGFARQSIVAAVGGGATIILNIMVAHIMNKEPLVPSITTGIIVIIAAVLLLAVTVEEAQVYTLSELKELFVAPSFLVYLSVQLIGLILLFTFFLDSVATRHLGLYYACISGIFGALSVLLGKLVAQVFGNAVFGDEKDVFTQSATYLFILGMAMTVCLQTHFLNIALASGDVMVIFPVFQVFWIGFSVLGGIIFYNETNEFNSMQWICYPVAMMLFIFGISFLTQPYRIRAKQTTESGQLSRPLI